MAVVTSDQASKAKLVYQVEDGEGGLRQSSRTFSNLLANVTDEALYTGVSAVAGLLDVSGAQVMRVDESVLVTE